MIVLRHFFWPGLKKDVTQFCKTCHVCQMVGKPNQVIPPAPLCPIPVMGEPFEHVLVDCVGPLPRSKSGNQYMLTIMDMATRYPEAIPLPKITAHAVVKALTKFFATFGLPKVLQTDQGTNFTSRVFEQVWSSFAVEHRVSSAYHPESQGALERWHQTLKSMLKKYCFETGKSWDEGVPLLLFAIRETVQESVGFSPAELVFGHVVRGPLKVLKESFMSENPVPQQSVLKYVSRFRERLYNACTMAKASLSSSQDKMKSHFDKRAVARTLQKGDQVLVFLPVMGDSLSARFSGPYRVEKKLSDTDYVIHTPDRRRHSRVCHINMLKLYRFRDTEIPTKQEAGSMVTTGPVVSSVPAVVLFEQCPAKHVDDDGLKVPVAPQGCPRLANSEKLKSLHTDLCHLGAEQQSDILNFVNSFPFLFSDVPSRTTVLEHDIEVGGAAPIRQHPYRVNQTKRAVMQNEVLYLLENKLAVASASPWSSPCLLVPKPDSTYRFCTDYRKLNDVTVPDSYPLPRLDDCVDTIGSAKYEHQKCLHLLHQIAFYSIPLCHLGYETRPLPFQGWSI